MGKKEMQLNQVLLEKWREKKDQGRNMKGNEGRSKGVDDECNDVKNLLQNME